MYRLRDYVLNGMVFANNMLRPRHKVLTQLMLYATTRCQSRCKHCAIWRKEEEHLTLLDIQAIMGSKCITPTTCVGLEGGEFLLHPEAEAIMEWFAGHHPNYTLLSNCLAPSRVIDAVRKYHPAHLYVSLDGNMETYIRMRGCNGHDRVMQVVETLKGEVPISLMFCLSPWNTFQDMEYVIGVALRHDIDVRIGIYGTMEFFDTTAELLEADMEHYARQIPGNIHDTSENYDFVLLYDEWRNGNLQLRCHSIFSQLVVHSNGNVPICQNRNIILGNIHDSSLDEIFNSRETHRIQCEMSHDCNGCWINFHRKYDIILLRNLERLLPRRLIKLAYGPYHWNKTDKPYKEYIKKTC